jgi:hypothetical protein
MRQSRTSSSAALDIDSEIFCRSVALDTGEIKRREGLIDGYIARHSSEDRAPEALPEYAELLRIKQQVLELFAQADDLAKQLRTKSRTDG